MTQQQREAIAGMLRASPFDPAGDLGEQRPLFEKMVTAAPVPAAVVTTPGQLGGVRVPDGTDELRARVTANPNLHHQTGMVAADGDIVMVHGRYEGLGPKPMVGVDIYRVEDGRVAEHWDVLQEEVSPTSSGHPMFTVPGRG
jgi:hypothetical protein